MRVLLTATANPAATGVDRYARALPPALRALGVDATLTPFARRELRIGPLRVGGLLTVQVARLWPRDRGRFDVVHALDPAAAVRGVDVVTVHDILPETQPAAWPVRADWVLARNVARRAKAIVCVSEVTRWEVAARWSVPDERLVTIHHGIDHDTFQPMEGPAPWPAGAGPVALFVGDDHPRKNLLLVVEALGELRRRGSTLRLARAGPSRHPATSARVREAAKRAGVDLMELGYLNDTALAQAYSAASVFLWPSLAEGFGFPPLEALACGTPVVALDTPINREVGGTPTRYHPSNVGAAADAIEATLAAPPSKDALRAHASRFTWARAARETLKVYDQVRSA